MTPRSRARFVVGQPERDPRSGSSRRRLPSSAVSSVSRPAAGSSSSSSDGRLASARATPTSLRWPCESSRGSRSRMSVISTASAAQATRLGAGARERREHLRQRPPQRRPLGRDQQVLLDVHVVEQLDRLEGARHATARELVRGWPVTSIPSKRTCPLEGRCAPISPSTSEVLPAPLGPIRPTIDPRGILKLMSSIATTPPYWMRSASTSSRVRQRRCIRLRAGLCDSAHRWTPLSRPASSGPPRSQRTRGFAPTRRKIDC